MRFRSSPRPERDEGVGQVLLPKIAMTPAKDDSKPETPQDANSEALATPKAKKPTATKPSDMSDGLIEFITAIDDYKRVHQRPFPSWGEVYDVLISLGYERPDAKKSA